MANTETQNVSFSVSKTRVSWPVLGHLQNVSFSVSKSRISWPILEHTQMCHFLCPNLECHGQYWDTQCVIFCVQSRVSWPILGHIQNVLFSVSKSRVSWPILEHTQNVSFCLSNSRVSWPILRHIQNVSVNCMTSYPTCYSERVWNDLRFCYTCNRDVSECINRRPIY